MSGKSGGTTGAHYDMEEEAEKEERQEKDPPLLKARAHGSRCQLFFQESFSPTTETLGRQCQCLLLSVSVLSEDWLLQCCLLWFGETLLVLRDTKCFSLHKVCHSWLDPTLPLAMISSNSYKFILNSSNDLKNSNKYNMSCGITERWVKCVYLYHWRLQL